MIGPAPAKINLALIVGPVRSDGKHELVTVFQRIDLGDRILVEPAETTKVEGFPADTIVRAALAGLGAEHEWRIRIEKNVPVAGGLGGGSSDAATALRLGNAQLAAPHPPERLHELAVSLGADVAFFLADGPQLGRGDGSDLEPIELPQDFYVVLLLPHGVVKGSTKAIYADFDERNGADGFDMRRVALETALARVRRARDLSGLPRNDLAMSPFADELESLGAFRADVSGAGPVIYGLFTDRRAAERAGRALKAAGRVWITVPAWYG